MQEVEAVKKQLDVEVSSKQDLAVRCTQLQELLNLAQQDLASRSKVKDLSVIGQRLPLF
jgi:hypothetical protein